jgi:hypothetical protein
MVLTNRLPTSLKSRLIVDTSTAITKYANSGSHGCEVPAQRK